MIRVKRQFLSRICQGDIIRDVEFIEYVTEKSGVIEVSKIVFPLVMVLTQDCDLEQDFRFRWSRGKRPSTQDKWLLTVLVAPIYNAEHVYAGRHLEELNLSMQQINKKRTEGNFLRNNERPRYHYLEFPKDIQIVPSVIDFKHYFSVNTIYLKKHKQTHFVCRVSELYREDVAQRFTNFLARIGLPDSASRE